MEEADLVGSESVTGEPRPVSGRFPLLGPQFRRPTPVVEADGAVRPRDLPTSIPGGCPISGSCISDELGRGSVGRGVGQGDPRWLALAHPWAGGGWLTPLSVAPVPRRGPAGRRSVRADYDGLVLRWYLLDDRRTWFHPSALSTFPGRNFAASPEVPVDTAGAHPHDVHDTYDTLRRSMASLNDAWRSTPHGPPGSS